MQPKPGPRRKPVRRDRRGRSPNPRFDIPEPTCKLCPDKAHERTPACPGWPLRRAADREAAIVYRLADMVLQAQWTRQPHPAKEQS